MRAPGTRGFTLLELMLGLVILGIFVAIAAWRIDATLPGWRANAVARWVLSQSRNASAIAARINEPVELRVESEADDGCVPRITVQSAPTLGTPVVYDTLCLRDYPGVVLGTGATSADVRCDVELDAALAALPNCSMCAGSPDAATLQNIVRVLPSGEVATQAGAAGATIAFTAATGSNPNNTVAVGIRNVSGRSRIYRPTMDGAGWECM